MNNKQESYILPECCQKCVEADGFQGAKGCNNRECECHTEGTCGIYVPEVESHEGVEEEAVKNGYMGEFLGYYKPVDVEELLHEFAAEYPNETVILGQHNKMQLSDWLRQKLTSLNTKKHE